MTDPSTGSEAGARLHLPIHVRWGDLDAYNHVNNTSILKLLEEARVRESDKAGALSAVVDWLARETRADVSTVSKNGFPITVGTA